MKFESNVVQFERIHWKCDGECRRNGRNVINGRQRHLLSGGCGMRQYRPLLSFHSTRNELPPPLAPIRRPQCHRRGRPSNGVVRRCRRPQIFRRIFPSRSRRQFDGSADLHEICIESGGGAADSNGQSFVAEFRAEEAEAAVDVRLLAKWVENGRKWIEIWNNRIHSEKREDSSGRVSSRRWRHGKVGQKLTRILRRRVATKFPFRRPQRPRPSAARNSAVFHLHKMQIFLLIGGVDGARQWRPLNVRSDQPTFTRWNPDTFPSNFICEHINR